MLIYFLPFSIVFKIQTCDTYILKYFEYHAVINKDVISTVIVKKRIYYCYMVTKKKTQRVPVLSQKLRSRYL